MEDERDFQSSPEAERDLGVEETKESSEQEVELPQKKKRRVISQKQRDALAAHNARRKEAALAKRQVKERESEEQKKLDEERKLEKYIDDLYSRMEDLESKTKSRSDPDEDEDAEPLSQEEDVAPKKHVKVTKQRVKTEAMRKLEDEVKRYREYTNRPTLTFL
jgi:hypothetical protein